YPAPAASAPGPAAEPFREALAREAASRRENTGAAPEPANGARPGTTGPDTAPAQAMPDQPEAAALAGAEAGAAALAQYLALAAQLAQARPGDGAVPGDGTLPGDGALPVAEGTGPAARGGMAIGKLAGDGIAALAAAHAPDLAAPQPDAGAAAGLAAG